MLLTCRVYEKEFTRSLLADPRWVRLFEECNFCVPSSHSTYLGPSSFYGLPDSYSNGALTEEEIAGLRYATCHSRPPSHSFSSFSFPLLIKKRGAAKLSVKLF